MKIISKHKDYYDWCVSIFGIDPIMIYDRTLYPIQKMSLSDSIVEELKFHICGKIYTVYSYKSEFYHFPIELMALEKLLDIEKPNHYTFNYGWSFSYKYKKNKIEKYNQIFKLKNGKSTDVNSILRLPIVIELRGGDLEIKSEKYSQILLHDYGFPKWYTAEEMFKNVYSFISWLKDNPEIPNKQTDIEKLNSHGFDDKISFRHRK